MRIITYNIMNGGEGRADPLAEVIQAQRPDLVGLIEANDPAVTNRICRRLGFDRIDAPGARHTIALLSRWPIIQTVNHALLSPGSLAGLLEATVQLPNSATFPVGVVQLRDREATSTNGETALGALVQAFAMYRTSHRPHVLIGDFNLLPPVKMRGPEVSPSESQAMAVKEFNEHEAALNELLAPLWQAGYDETFNTVNGASQQADVQSSFNDTSARYGTFTTQQPTQRVGRILTFGVEIGQVQRAWIERDRLARYASDHFPAGVDLSLGG